MGELRDKNLYLAVYEAARQAIQAGNLPTTLLPGGTVIYRVVDAEYVHLSGRLIVRSAAAEVTKVRDQYLDKNRFSGASPLSQKVPVRYGGCYFYLQEGAGMAEMLHYATAVPQGQLEIALRTVPLSIPHLLASKRIFKLRVLTTRLLANFSLRTGGHAASFLRQLESVAAVRQALGGMSLAAALMSDDYAAARALGHACQSLNYLGGLLAQTARQTDRAGESGDNLCLFGVDGAPLKDVRAESAYFFFKPGVLAGLPGIAPDTQLIEIGVEDECHFGVQLELGL